MKKKIGAALLIFLAVSAVSFAIDLSTAPVKTNCPSIASGLSYLDNRYNPALGLLNEAPHAAPNIYWLTNDNALAAYTLAQLGQFERSAAIQDSVHRFGIDSNGLIEVVWGIRVTFPPFDARNEVLSQIGADQIKQEYHIDGQKFLDWEEYANLGFLGALNEFHHGDPAISLVIFSNTLAQFDGVGFHDKAFQGQYETYKLALALFTGTTIKAAMADSDAMLGILQAMQAADGGFYTHYRDILTPEGDTNTETTALALLAQHVYGCAQP